MHSNHTVVGCPAALTNIAELYRASLLNTTPEYLGEIGPVFYKIYNLVTVCEPSKKFKNQKLCILR